MKQGAKTDSGTCFVFGGAPIKELSILPQKGDFIIAADAGLDFLQKNNLIPDLIVGDFDSLGYKPVGENIIVHPTEKDSTDTDLSLKEGLRRGFRRFVIYGGTGGRADHTAANVQSLCFLAGNGAQGYLADGEHIITALSASSLSLPNDMEGYISVFCASGECRGVGIKGLKYTLNDAVLDFCTPLGVSNEFTGEQAEISVREGTLVIMWNDTTFSPDRYSVTPLL